MNKEKFVGILSGVAKIYGKDIDIDTMELWLSFFKENTTEEFRQAINEHIKTSKYFPTVADIKTKIYEQTHMDEVSDTELWEKFLIAVRNGSYGAEKEFKKLPDVVKEFVGSPRQLQEFAIMPSNEIHSIVKGQFLKQIANIKENFKNYEITGKQNLLSQNEIYQIEEVID